MLCSQTRLGFYQKEAEDDEEEEEVAAVSYTYKKLGWPVDYVAGRRCRSLGKMGLGNGIVRRERVI